MDVGNDKTVAEVHANNNGNGNNNGNSNNNGDSNSSSVYDSVSTIRAFITRSGLKRNSNYKVA